MTPLPAQILLEWIYYRDILHWNEKFEGGEQLWRQETTVGTDDGLI